MTLFIRAARESEDSLLSDLALDSRGHWGDDAAFLDACREVLSVTTTDIQTQPHFVAKEQGTLLGFYSLCLDGSRARLDK